jgi:hypothetical protein
MLILLYGCLVHKLLTKTSSCHACIKCFVNEHEWDTQNKWGFGFHPSSCSLKTREHNVSETGSVIILRREGDTYSVKSLKNK